MDQEKPLWSKENLCCRLLLSRKKFFHLILVDHLLLIGVFTCFRIFDGFNNLYKVLA